MSWLGVRSFARGRVSEIGIRKTLGASQIQIAGMFLVEGAVLGLIGASLALVLSAAVVVLLNETMGWWLDIRPWMILTPIGVGVLSSIMSALRTAARMGSLLAAEAIRLEDI